MSYVILVRDKTFVFWESQGKLFFGIHIIREKLYESSRKSGYFFLEGLYEPCFKKSG